MPPPCLRVNSVPGQSMFERYFYQGRYLDETPSISDDGTLHKTILFALEPFDLKGVGTFTVRTDAAEFDQKWAYLKSVRRSRRLSSSSWMNPLGGLDIIEEDVDIIDSHPSWYKEHKLIGKQFILAPVNERQIENEQGSTDQERYPMIDLQNPPYSNLTVEWEPVEVYVIDSVPPDEHPYGRKRIYVVKDLSRSSQAEIYDKKGEFWKHFIFALGPYESEDGGHRCTDAKAASHIDYQANRGTNIITRGGFVFTDDGPESVSLTELEQVAR